MRVIKRMPKANGGSLAVPREQLPVTSETRCDVSPSEVCFQPRGSVQLKARSYASTREEVSADVFPRDNVSRASGHQQIHASVGKDTPAFALQKIPSQDWAESDDGVCRLHHPPQLKLKVIGKVPGATDP